jgi:hypothetical protein
MSPLQYNEALVRTIADQPKQAVEGLGLAIAGVYGGRLPQPILICAGFRTIHSSVPSLRRSVRVRSH